MSNSKYSRRLFLRSIVGLTGGTLVPGSFWYIIGSIMMPYIVKDPILITNFDDFKVNDQVFHEIFGRGTIISIINQNDGNRVRIKFSDCTKKMIFKYARLKKFV